MEFKSFKTPKWHLGDLSYYFWSNIVTYINMNIHLIVYIIYKPMFTFKSNQNWSTRAYTGYIKYGYMNIKSPTSFGSHKSCD